MRTRRRKRPTLNDLARLGEAHRIILELMGKLNPATPEYLSALFAADAVRTAAIDWTGDPYVWRSSDGLDRGRVDPTNPFVKRPDHPAWPK